MKGQEREETKAEPRRERESTERTAAPPIEREHETYKGVLEEDEHHEQERESSEAHPHVP